MYGRYRKSDRIDDCRPAAPVEDKVGRKGRTVCKGGGEDDERVFEHVPQFVSRFDGEALLGNERFPFLLSLHRVAGQERYATLYPKAGEHQKEFGRLFGR